MRVYIIAFIISFIVALVFGAGWYALFGYNSTKTILDNVVIIFSNLSFWRGVTIWTFLYAIFFAFPVVFIKYHNKGNV